jgi:hypothetical protein
VNDVAIKDPQKDTKSHFSIAILFNERDFIKKEKKTGMPRCKAKWSQGNYWCQKFLNEQMFLTRLPTQGFSLCCV